MATTINSTLLVFGAFFADFGLLLIIYSLRKERAHELIFMRPYNYVEPATYRKMATGITLVGLVIFLLSFLVP